MSSDGSSGITQFGLYRTIDARTEEFLRLSRKRQIRQGCACAAVSTAITVTVVVSVLLVYEYSIISGSNKNKSYTKPTWIGFINDSADATPFDAKFSKTKLNLDKSTIKLLPILIKALKQNIFFEKVIEDYTSANPIYEPNDTTEQQYEKNIFSDPRNWFKAPASRVYAIEFKTSPIVYYQPTRNLEYMTKIRKIRDYKRILNYFEKMINDKVSPGSNLSMMKRESQNKNPSDSYTTPVNKGQKLTQKRRVDNLNKNINRPTVIETNSCKCPIKLGEIINKLWSNLNQLIPHSKISLSTLCNKIKPTKLKKNTSKTSKTVTTTKFTTLKPINVITTPTFIEKIKATSEKAYFTSQNNIKGGVIRKYLKSKKVNMPLRNNLNKNDNNEIDLPETRIDNYEKQTTIKNFLEATEPKNVKSYTTKPMNAAVNRITNFMYQRSGNDFVSTKTSVDNKISNKPILSNEEYDDYFITTPKIATKYDALDLHNLKLIKSGIVTSNNAKKLKNKFSEVVRPNVIQTVSDNKDPVLSIQKYKNNDFSFENKIGSLFLQKLINNKPNIKIEKETTKAPNIEKSTDIYKPDPTTHNEHPFGYDEKMLEDDVFEEYKSKQSLKFSDFQHINETDVTSTPTIIPKHQDVQEDVESKENVPTKSTSMLPPARSVYLEIQRNDWKQDDAHDYDFHVILLIYEYGIAVEWSLVQNRRIDKNAEEGNIYDQPKADRLDRSYFGFDQDYYERMPLLVNAMQENSYLDPTLEVIPASQHNNYIHNLTTTPKNYKTNNVRRTSPRPFFFEYRSPTPLPFSKKYGSRTWVEKYRNAQRLQNIRQIIKYLEKTINAKVGDMHTKTPSTHIAFTGMYVEPMINVSEKNEPKTKVDLVFQSSIKSEIAHSNHQSDPLFLFKPENPGEVNLLADGFLRFSPVPTPIPEISTIPPMFKKMGNNNNDCFGKNCDEKNNINLFHNSHTVPTTEPASTTKSFSVMLNLFPLKSVNNAGDKNKLTLNKSQVDLNKIYFTTSRPTIHFKRKPTVPIRRTFIRRKSRILYHNKTNIYKKNTTVSLDLDKNDQEAAGTNMIVHVKVYSPDIKTETSSREQIVETTTEPFKPVLIEPTQPYSTETPFFLSTSQGEDFHVGSSGIIPIEDRTTTPPLPQVTTMLPFFDTTVIPEGISFTTPSDILKFNHEDAKIPQEYINIRNRDVANRRNFREGDDNDGNNVNKHVVTTKNPDEITQTTTMASTIETTQEFQETTTIQTYVPQINGHYRSISQNLRDLNVTPESSRKRRLELVISGFRKPTYVPMYVEIKRNYTKKVEDDE